MKTKNKDTAIIVQIPDKAEIELVQANKLRHYELFQWLVALLLPIAVGFWTAYFTGQKGGELLWSASVFSAVSGLFIFLAYRHRREVFSKVISKIAYLNSFKDK